MLPESFRFKRLNCREKKGKRGKRRGKKRAATGENADPLMELLKKVDRPIRGVGATDILKFASHASEALLLRLSNDKPLNSACMMKLTPKGAKRAPDAKIENAILCLENREAIEEPPNLGNRYYNHYLCGIRKDAATKYDRIWKRYANFQSPVKAYEGFDFSLFRQGDVELLHQAAQ